MSIVILLMFQGPDLSKSFFKIKKQLYFQRSGLSKLSPILI
jgi:hypothetical protein